MRFILDGASNNAQATFSEARRSHQEEIHIISVGVGNNMNMQELENMASHPVQSNVLLVENFNALTRIMDVIKEAICNSESVINNL